MEDYKRKALTNFRIFVIFVIILTIGVMSLVLIFGDKKDKSINTWQDSDINISELDSTMNNVTTSQDQEWSYPDNYGFNVTMNLDYSNSLNDSGEFEPKMFNTDGGLGHYVSHRYPTASIGFWNEIVFYIDSYCSSLSKSLSIENWDKSDFDISYYRNSKNKSDEFRLICKDKSKYELESELILTYMFFDNDTYRTVYPSEWIQKKLGLNKSISDELSVYTQESISETSGGDNN